MKLHEFNSIYWQGSLVRVKIYDAVRIKHSTHKNSRANKWKFRSRSEICQKNQLVAAFRISINQYNQTFHGTKSGLLHRSSLSGHAECAALADFHISLGVIVSKIQASATHHHYAPLLPRRCFARKQKWFCNPININGHTINGA